MEATEDAFLVAAIGWLVQTILASLQANKLESWVPEAGLAEKIGELRREVKRVGTVVADVKGTAIGDTPLAQSLGRLKELLYDADDALDELDYYRLQQQVQGDNWHEPEGMHGATLVDKRSRANDDIPSSSVGRIRSKAWDNFHVITDEAGKPLKAKSTDGPIDPSFLGTGDATENSTSAAVGISPSRKRMRDGDLAEITRANTKQWNTAEISSRIQKIISELQEIGQAVSDLMKPYQPHSVESSNHFQNTTSETCLRTSSNGQMKVYGRLAEKNSIIKLMKEGKSEGVTVLPIVGIGGVGKTALAQYVFSDPVVQSQFEHMIWVSVSKNLDETELSTKILDLFPQETHNGLHSFSTPQQVLRNQMKSKSVLLVLDDVCYDMNDCQWIQLLDTLKSSNSNGSVILVTNRKLSVAKKIGTTEPIKLSSLKSDDFWLLFKACSFGDENYEGHRSLSIIGRQIAKKLKGNPLAAVTAGGLLRDHLTIEHWTDILKNEDWKSLGLSGGIMPALKLTYNQVPYHLHQCFSYCSIFPENYQFLGNELVNIWISQGFVRAGDSSKRLEEIGMDYLADMVNMGYFQQTEKEVFSQGIQACYVICGLMHDFGRIISRNECATLDSLQCNELMPRLPSIRHLSVISDFEHSTDQNGNILWNEKFEVKLISVLASLKKLRTLVLIGQYDKFFLESFKKIIQKAEKLRLLQISSKYADLVSSLCVLVNPTHLRYLKLEANEGAGASFHGLSTFFHLQLLDIDPYTDLIIPHGIYNLVSLRHLAVEEGIHASFYSIGKMTSLQELQNFIVQNSSGSDIAQLQSMNQLVQLGVSQLENVTTRDEACGAKLRDKRHLEMLRFAWTHTVSQDKYDSYISSEQYLNIVDINEELSRVNDCGPSYRPSMDTAKEVLEGLEPHMDLKHLQISGYTGTVAPAWLASNIARTSLQTLHLEYCAELQILPSLEGLPFLSKLKLKNMQKVIEAVVPPLEELILIGMPMLQRCSSNSTRELNCSLRILKIKKCHALKVFDIIENDPALEIQQKSFFPCLRKLVICDCPLLKVHTPLPPSTTISALFISGVSTLPAMEGSVSDTLTIGTYDDDFDKVCDEMVTLDDRILAFHHLRGLKTMRIQRCPNLESISLNGLREIISLESLEINNCERVFSSEVLLDHACEELTRASRHVFPSLLRLSIVSCGISGRQVSMMLRHAPVLEELVLSHCPQFTQLSIEEGKNDEPSLFSATQTSSSVYHDAAMTRSDIVGLLRIPLNLIASMKKILIIRCPSFTFNGRNDGFAGLTSLEKLEIWGGPNQIFTNNNEGNAGLPTHEDLESWDFAELLSCLFDENGNNGKSNLCFPSELNYLKILRVTESPSFKSLQLHSCTTLEKLNISNCKSLTLESLQSLGSLRYLKVEMSPSLAPCLECLSGQHHQLLPRLEKLEIDDPFVLTTSFCKHLTSLQRLELVESKEKSLSRLTEEQERSLLFLTSLQELQFRYCKNLVALPRGLHSLPSLKRLHILNCGSLLSLPEKGLPHSLEELKIGNFYGCSQQLIEQCKMRATRKLKVKIGLHYIN
uniref:Uncharacterized protein n=1 Tax=Avena sativa TaxID=4498 RepID=A0ACD5TZ54_AVESA